MNDFLAICICWGAVSIPSALFTSRLLRGMRPRIR